MHSDLSSDFDLKELHSPYFDWLSVPSCLFSSCFLSLSRSCCLSCSRTTVDSGPVSRRSWTCLWSSSRPRTELLTSVDCPISSCGWWGRCALPPETRTSTSWGRSQISCLCSSKSRDKRGANISSSWSRPQVIFSTLFDSNSLQCRSRLDLERLKES